MSYRPLTIEEAKAAGFTVDTTCYPHFGYKGPRFRPSESVNVLTDIEGHALKVVEMQQRLIEDMSRFIDQMALQDYALLNEAPIAARQALEMVGR